MHDRPDKRSRRLPAARLVDAASPAGALRSKSRKLRLLPLIGATYFMVAGGPYGLEDILGMAGYRWAIVLLLVVPFVWSVPVSLMVGELASAMPVEGGYYVWVRRALGPFWGFQEGWLSLTASVFDMAIYPVTFVLYLGRLAPGWTTGMRGTLWAFAVVFGCAVWNLRGARAVGRGAVGLLALLLAPFMVLSMLGFRLGWATHAALPAGGLVTGSFAGAVAVCMWNYMGWDNASTVAQEVEDPQRTYPRTMLTTAALVACTYLVPLLAVAAAGIPAERFSTGAWVDAARYVGGRHGVWLALAVVAGGTISGVGMFNALMLSYTRVPFAMASEGLLPAVFARTNRAGVPWASVLACACAWALAVQMTFERLISIDLVLYGAALVLEFVALVVLRVRAPAMPRPFRIPGGTAVAVAAGGCPALLIGYAAWSAREERMAGMPSLVFAGLLAAFGPLVYLLARRWGRHRGG